MTQNSFKVGGTTISEINSEIQSKKITGLSLDSRTAKAGDIFFAMRGSALDGNKFIDEVIKKGVKCIVTDNKSALNNPNIAKNKVKIWLVEDVRKILPALIKIFYPLLPKYLVAATGTNGKTSVVSYCRQLYSLLGQLSGSIGTLGVECSQENLSLIQEILARSPLLTTLDPITIRQILHILAEEKVNYVAFEASSHGLVQKRLEGIKVHAACFTSFSQDHLDYHKNMNSYLSAKLTLFTNNLLADSVAILNSAIPQLEFIKNYLQSHNIKFRTVGTNGDLNITDAKQSIYGQNISFIYKDQKYNFTTSIIGSFQATNLLIAAMMVHITGFPFEEVIAKLPFVQAVKGRLQRVIPLSDDFAALRDGAKPIDNRRALSNDARQFISEEYSKHTSPYHIFIDYAHTPEALEKTLLELQKIKLAKGLLKVIFGCGGNRDTAKRAKMGQIASKIADKIIITDDNPRDEQPSLIRQQIIQGIDNNYVEIADRETAITQTILKLNKDDILLIAGKGHEDYQIIKDKKFFFSDFEVASNALNSIIC